MSPISEAARIVARAAATAFGGEPRVDRFYDEPEPHSVDVLTCVDRPTPGFSTYSTVSLHAATNLLEGADIRVEVAGIAPRGVAEFPNVLATAAFRVIKDGWLCAPGVVFPALLSDYGLSSTMEHVLWAPPSPWEELSSVEIVDDLSVHWLLAIPISEAERSFLVDRGYDVLEALLAEHEAEYFDLERESLV